MKPRILFVDDETHILESLADLWGYDYDVATAADGASGLALLTSWDPAVIVSDMRMPGMDGAAFLAAARAMAPHAIRILLTGQADLEAAGRAVNVGGIFKLLTKPCPPDLLAAALIEALGEHANYVRGQQIEAQMARAEQLATLGTLTAMMNHEMNNALTILGSAIDSVEEDVGAARVPVEETLRQLVRGRARLLAQTRGATTLARRSDPLMELLDVKEVLGEMVGAMRSAGLAVRAEIVLEAEDGVAVVADRNELDQVILNLVKNALDALPNGRGRIVVGARRRAGLVVVTIADTGSGIAPQDLAKVFEPYYTTKPPTQGTGLGLPIVKQIVAKYGGSVDIVSHVGVGTRVVIELPAAILRPVLRQAAATLSP